MANTITPLIEALENIEQKLRKQAGILSKASVAVVCEEEGETDQDLPLPLRVRELRQRRLILGDSEGFKSEKDARVMELEQELESQRLKHLSQLQAAEREISRLARARGRNPTNEKTEEPPATSCDV